MQLMSDAIAVMGSRHGLVFEPMNKRCGIVRFDKWGSLPGVEITAGVIVEGKEYTLPLTSQGNTLDFLDQRMTPCTASFMGIQRQSALRLRLDVATPWRPRDKEFSTTPVLGLSLSVRQHDHFRWDKRPAYLDEVEIFIEVKGLDTQASESGKDTVDLTFNSNSTVTRPFVPGGAVQPRPDAKVEALAQRDRLVAITGKRVGTRFTRRVRLNGNDDSEPLQVGWCSWNAPALQVQNDLCPFLYSERFASLEAVVAWARKHGASIFENAARVDGVVRSSNCSKDIQNLMALTLHSWLINTWWVRRPDGRENFTVWEGNCFFHSTVDVEFTQSPFYLALWPELLGLELDLWPEYSKSGSLVLGDAGKDTLFLSHDCGSMSSANGQDYHHEMEVEESGNYVVLAYAYWRRTGDDKLIRKHGDTIRAYLDFIAACDTERVGCPRLGVANTIDDASPAVQYGRQQTYLAVKALASFATGAVIMDHLKKKDLAGKYRDLAELSRKAILSRGWLGDHFSVLLDKRADGLVDPWSGKPLEVAEVPGWNAYHIYTENVCAPLDMVGFDLGLDEEKLATDLRTATDRCLREYGCAHSDYADAQGEIGWVAMNLIRDCAAFYRGLDLRYMSDRYWSWQTTNNTQSPTVFFETFGGNNLHYYPRGIVIWGFFDALAGLAIDRVAKLDNSTPKIAQVRVPRLIDADWSKGKARMMESASE